MSAAAAVYVTVDVALRADSAFMAAAVDRGVYAAGDVPDNQRLTDDGDKVGYAEIGSSTEGAESDVGSFGTEGQDGVLTVAFRATSKRTALLLYKLARAVLHNTPLTAGLPTFNTDSLALITGTFRLVEDYPNPDGGHTAIAQYLTNTVSTA